MNLNAAGLTEDFDHTAKASVGDALTRVSAAVVPGIAKKLYFADVLKLFSSPTIDVGSVQLTTCPETNPGVAGMLSFASAPGGKQPAFFISTMRCSVSRHVGVPANVVLPARRLRFQPGSFASTVLVASTVAKSDAFCADAPARLRKCLPFDVAVRHAARSCRLGLRRLEPEPGHDLGVVHDPDRHDVERKRGQHATPPVERPVRRRERERLDPRLLREVGDIAGLCQRQHRL